jgi:hypothetical protein
MQMNTFKPLMLAIIAGTFLLSSCYDTGTVYYDQLDVTLTKYDTEFDFGSYSSFTIPDSTILKTNFLEDPDIADFYAPGGTSMNTLEAVREKFIERGYVFTDDSSAADFFAVPTILMMRHSGAVYYPPGWWWGYPGWGWGGWPGWGWPGYPWDPGYVGYYSYKTGTVVIEMVDGDSFRNVEDWLGTREGDVPVLDIRWSAFIDGYLSSNADYNAERAQRGFEEAFEQSPYLKQ